MKINSVEIKELEPLKTIAIQHVGDYSGIADAFQKLTAWATEKGYWAKGPRMLGVYHDDPSRVPAEKLRSSACLEEMDGMEPAEGMVRYTISGGKYLVMNAEVKMSEYAEAWQKADAAVSERQLEPDTRDHYELYISSMDATQGEDAPWNVEFRIPVKAHS